jgi:hypothetical protein
MRSDWRKEFNELGVTRVRARISTSAWDEKKLRAARRWVWWRRRGRPALEFFFGTLAVAAVGSFFV